MTQINPCLVFIYTIGGRVCSFLGHGNNQTPGWIINQNFRKIFLHENVRLLYSTSALKVKAGKFNTTITIKLFFLWLHNAYEFDSRPTTFVS
jgi:hypothetical protein